MARVRTSDLAIADMTCLRLGMCFTSTVLLKAKMMDLNRAGGLCDGSTSDGVRAQNLAANSCVDLSL